MDRGADSVLFFTLELNFELQPPLFFVDVVACVS